MEEKSRQYKRIGWIDWMKAIGIFFIVLGHFCSVGEKFIYAFHVPLFFIISGFLSKKECDEYMFWRKLWYNLAVPMLIMTAIYLVYLCILQLSDSTFEVKKIYWLVRKVLLGIVSGFGSLWFVYTLILLKLFQYFSSKTFFIFHVIVMLALAYVYNTSELTSLPFFIKAPNTIVNICTAYPFFVIGVFFQQYKNKLIGLNGKLFFVLVFICGLLLVRISNYHNGYVAMYHCDYGGNMVWFLIGGISGSMMIFALSRLVGKTPKIITTISRGTIIILGFQILFIDLIRSMFPASYFDILFAVIIVVMFVPIIRLIEKYFPLMAGKYRVSNKHVN